MCNFNHTFLPEFYAEHQLDLSYTLLEKYEPLRIHERIVQSRRLSHYVFRIEGFLI